MNKLTLTLIALPAIALASCGEEPAPEPAPVETATPEPIQTMSAPDQALFSEKLAEACPALKPVNTAVCRRAGIGSTKVVCEYGLGDDEYLRHKATITPVEGEWALSDTETVCAQGA